MLYSRITLIQEYDLDLFLLVPQPEGRNWDLFLVVIGLFKAQIAAEILKNKYTQNNNLGTYPMFCVLLLDPSLVYLSFSDVVDFVIFEGDVVLLLLDRAQQLFAQGIAAQFGQSPLHGDVIILLRV